jgi:hypothetical protein
VKKEKKIKTEEQKDRLSELEAKLALKKGRGNQLFWIKYNPGADFDYDIKDATEDIHWMIFEIKRLRDENEQYKEFIESYKDQIARELQ